MSVNNRLPADLSQGVVAPQSNAPACSIVAPSLEKNPLANQSLNSSHEGSNPEQENIPCHRVVNRFGGLSDAFAFGGRDAHRRLLEDEGVEVFDYRVDLAKYQV
ncbi:MAG: MGMT family protein [Oscillospiraceae bacterium]|nr:MGMT family protein [Oscillospiraceae bacterium]